jgi:hypothetical protein
MTIPVELSPPTSTASYLADLEADAFLAETLDPNDGLFLEITERRAQLENAEILRGARAL